MFSCEFCEILKNTFSYRILPVAVSAIASYLRLYKKRDFMKKETLAQEFSCEFCEISKNTFFTEHLQETAPYIIFNWLKIFVLERTSETYK